MLEEGTTPWSRSCRVAAGVGSLSVDHEGTLTVSWRWLSSHPTAGESCATRSRVDVHVFPHLLVHENPYLSTGCVARWARLICPVPLDARMMGVRYVVDSTNLPSLATDV